MAATPDPYGGLQIVALVFAIVAVPSTIIGTWAVLRATVADLKLDVRSLKDLLVLVKTLEAEKRATDAELDRVRSRGHDNQNRIARLAAELGERIAACETSLDIRQRANTSVGYPEDAERSNPSPPPLAR